MEIKIDIKAIEQSLKEKKRKYIKKIWQNNAEFVKK